MKKTQSAHLKSRCDGVRSASTYLDGDLQTRHSTAQVDRRVCSSRKAMINQLVPGYRLKPQRRVEARKTAIMKKKQEHRTKSTHCAQERLLEHDSW